MPYKISDNGLCVHKLNMDGSMGDVVKCHKTPDEAAAHMRAIYANVEDAATKETGPASDYLIVEDAEQPSTYHLRVKVDGQPDHTLMGAAWAALHGGYRGNKYEGPGKQEAIAKLRKLYEAEDMPVPNEKEASFSVYKQSDGHYRWVIFSSSSYRDREGEIVSQKALEQDTARMNFTKDYGALDWWHTPIVLGTCDFSAMEGRISVESGTFADDWIGERIASKAAELGASRSFYHPITEPDAQGVYHNIQTFRRAILPQGHASNLLTQVYVAKENENMILDKVKELIDKLGGGPEAEAKVSALLDAAQTVDKAAETAGIAHKETEVAPAPETAKPEAAPEPEKAKEAPILEQPGMFVSDMKPEEFSALMTKAMGDSQMATMAQMSEMMSQMQAMMKQMLGEAAMEQAKEIAALATKQAALETQVKELNGLTPRGYRATQDPATITEKQVKGPGADEKAPYFNSFVNKMVLGQTGPTPPAP